MRPTREFRAEPEVTETGATSPIARSCSGWRSDSRSSSASCRTSSTRGFSRHSWADAAGPVPPTHDMIDRPAAPVLRTPSSPWSCPTARRAASPPGTLPADVVRSIGERLLRAAVAVSVDGEMQDLMTPLRTGGAFRVLTERDPEALAVLRHSAAHVLATAVRRLRPDAKIGFGPAIDDGFYYDFEVATPFTPEDLAAFEDEMRKVVAGEVSVRARGGRRATRRAKRFADDPLKLERLDDLGDRRGHLDLHRRAVHRPVPRPARARHVAPQALQAAAHRRRVLARRREAADAAAHLRDGVLQEGRARRVPLPHRGGEEARPPRARASELDLFMFHPFSPGAVVLDRARHDRCTTRSCDYVRERQQRRLPRDQDAAAVQQGAVGDRRGTGGSTARTCSSCSTTRRGARHLAQADELPVALPAVSARRSTRTASCRCATSRSTCCIATR